MKILQPMSRSLLVVVSMLYLAATGLAQEWIWHGRTAGDRDVRFFRKAFAIAESPEKATLWVSCDNHATVYLDGVRLGETGEWSEPTGFDVAKALKPGEHLIAIRAENQGGQAGLLARLDLTPATSSKSVIRTDPTWRVSDRGLAAWNRPGAESPEWVGATSLGKYGVAPWGAVFDNRSTDSANRRLRAATPAEALTVAKGFKVELLRSAEPGEGSWVSMTVDSRGRLIVSPQDGEPMLRFSLDASGKLTNVETIDLPVRSAMGLLSTPEGLYVNGTGPQGYHLYRLTDTDGDDRYDKIELLRKWKGGPGEHGTHGIVLGPDNKLYIVNGNFVDVPDDIRPTSPHRNYRDDLVLPRMEDGNGFGAGRKPPGGFVLRLNRDGTEAELFGSGQRNTYDIAFNPEGELFGFDSDMEWDWGTPWYRPTRVYHIVSGADHGFREGTAKWPEYYPDSLPATVNIGIGSPTGVRFGTGAKFPDRYQKALFVLDWSYGRIIAVHLTPDGASYRGNFEPFVTGKPLNVTDVEVGRDGAMYFTIGGRKTQGGLYRITYTGDAAIDVANVRDIPPAAPAKASEARTLRHQLEAFHGRHDAAALAVAWPQLDNPDRFIRYAARLAVESQPVAQWRQRALDESRPQAGLTALLALARYGAPQDRDDIVANLGRHWPDGLNESQKLEAIRVCQVTFARMGVPTGDMARDISAGLLKVFRTGGWPFKRELSQLLVALEAPDMAKALLDLRDEASTQEEQLHYMVTLRHVKTGWTPDLRKRYFGWFAATSAKPDQSNAAYIGLRKTTHPETTVSWFKDVARDYSDGSSYNNFLINLRKAVLAGLGEGEKSELASLFALPPETKPTATKRTFKIVREWKTADLLADLDKVGSGRNYNNGREAFTAAQCGQCHRFGLEGGAVGPDITAISSRFSRKDILEAIIDPSKVVSEQYQNITVTKKDGDDVTGRLVEETDTKLVLIPNQLTGERVEIKRAEVATRAAARLSPMPEGLVNILTRDDLLDLLAYLESAGKKEHAAFRK